MPRPSAMRVARAVVVLVAALALLGAPLQLATARADSGGDLDRARKHFEAGQALFDEGRYRDAIIEFTQADAIIETPINRYNIGLCHDRLDNEEAALREYRAYLEAMPEAPNRREVAARIAALEGSSEAGDDEPEPRAPEAERPRSEDEGEAEPADAEPEPAHDEAEERDGEPERWPPPERRPPSGWGDGDRAPAPVEPVENDEPGRETKPLYKSWWFWGVAGVSAVILVHILTSSSSSGGERALEIHEPSPSGGMTLWRF